MSINQGESTGESDSPFSQGQLNALQSMIAEAVAGAIQKQFPLPPNPPVSQCFRGLQCSIVAVVLPILMYDGHRRTFIATMTLMAS